MGGGEAVAVRVPRLLYEEARRLLEEGDTVQASEKLYKAAEEALKAMAEAVAAPEAREARSKGRWTLRLLDLAAKRLAELVGEDVLHGWDHAYFLHVEGFHEARLAREQVEARLPYIQGLVEAARRLLAGEARRAK